MNIADVCAVLMEQPREVFTSATASNLRAVINLPPVGSNKAPTPVELNVYGKACDRFRHNKANDRLLIYGAKLRFDVNTRAYSLHGGVVHQITDEFPILNRVILSGRCVKDLDLSDPRVFKTTPDGLMICNQSLSVYMGKNQADLFNFYAINTANDKLNNAEIIANFTRKGVGITVAGRLVTDAWTDKQSNERKINTKIQVNQITLAPKADATKNTESQTKPVQTNTPVAPSSSDASLWGAANAPQPTDPWTHASGGGLPDLPGQYSNSPSFDEVPF